MMSFQERAKLGLEQLSKQSPVTLAKARKQAQALKAMTLTELNDRTDRSLADSAAGRLTSTAQLKAEMKSW